MGLRPKLVPVVLAVGVTHLALPVCYKITWFLHYEANIEIERVGGCASSGGKRSMSRSFSLHSSQSADMVLIEKNKKKKAAGPAGGKYLLYFLCLSLASILMLAYLVAKLEGRGPNGTLSRAQRRLMRRAGFSAEEIAGFRAPDVASGEAMGPEMGGVSAPAEHQQQQQQQKEEEEEEEKEIKKEEE